MTGRLAQTSSPRHRAILPLIDGAFRADELRQISLSGRHAFRSHQRFTSFSVQERQTSSCEGKVDDGGLAFEGHNGSFAGDFPRPI